MIAVGLTVLAAIVMGADEDEIAALLRRARHSDRVTFVMRNRSSAPVTYRGVMYAQPSHAAAPPIVIGQVPAGGASEMTVVLPAAVATLESHVSEGKAGGVLWDGYFDALHENDGPNTVEVDIDDLQVSETFRSRSGDLSPKPHPRLTPDAH